MVGGSVGSLIYRPRRAGLIPHVMENKQWTLPNLSDYSPCDLSNVALKGQPKCGAARLTY